MKYRVLLIHCWLIFYFIPNEISAQTKNINIGFKILDEGNLEPIFGAMILCNETKQITNSEGYTFFKTTNTELNVEIKEFNKIIFAAFFKIENDTTIIIKIPSNTRVGNLPEVNISTKKSLIIGKNGFAIDKLFLQNVSIPLSTQDPIQLLKLFPGVTTSQEMNANIHIRGGNAYNTRYYLDHIPVPNITHSFGLFSFFDMQTLRHIDYFNQNISSEYGVRGAGFIKFHTKDPDLNNYNTSILFNPFLVSGSFNGKILKDKLGIFVNYRKSIFNDGYDFLLPIFSNFQDVLVKAKYHINDKSNITAIFLDSYDKINQDFGLGLELADTNYNRFRTMSCSYTYFSNNQIKHEVSTFYSKHKNLFISKVFGENSIDNILNDWNMKYIRTNYSESAIIKKAGVELQYFQNNNISQNQLSENLMVLTALTDLKKNLKSVDFYGNLRLNYIPSLNSVNPEFKVGLEFNLNNNLFYAEFNKFVNIFHTLSNNIIPINTDYLFLSDNQFKPQEIYELALGYKKQVKKFDFGTTLFYRDYKNSLDYIDLVFSNLYNKENVTFVNHISYGCENYLNISLNDKHSIFINYTYSKAILQNDFINLGQSYNANFDRPHLLNSIYSYKLKKIVLTATFTLQSGRPLSVPILMLPNNIVMYSDRNEYRLPLFHKMDLGMKYRFGKKIKQTFDFHIYNVYARRNVFAILYTQDKKTFEYDFRYMSFFPFLPTFSYGIEL